jgi:two-component system chemotaxis response regulator CheB
MIKVLVVDDSLVMRKLITHILTTDPEIEVIGTASNGQEAVDLVVRLQPDLVTMDLHMPKMNGVEAIRQIMKRMPLPIVVMSSSNQHDEVISTFQAIQAGAVSFIQKPSQKMLNDADEQTKKLSVMIKGMANKHILEKAAKRKKAAAKHKADMEQKTVPLEKVALIVIGASTGGPIVLQKILEGLSPASPPIMIVQHIATGFIEGLAEWLAQTTGAAIRIAKKDEKIQNGSVYLAPDHFHIGINRNGTIALSKDTTKRGVCPSVAHLFRSAAENYGTKTMGIILTGMGKDGSIELLKLKEAGAITIAQDKESSVVHGMAGKAIELGAAQHVMSVDNIAKLIADCSKLTRIVS